MHQQTHVRYELFLSLCNGNDDFTSLHCRILNDNRGSQGQMDHNHKRRCQTLSHLYKPCYLLVRSYILECLLLLYFAF